MKGFQTYACRYKNQDTRRSSGTLFLIAALMLTVLPPSAIAEQLYVSDQLTIQLRSGPGFEYRIRNAIRSGRGVEAMELSDDKQWRKVIYRDQEGWVEAQFLSNKPAARNLLSQAQQQVTQLQSKNAELQSTVARLDTELRSLKAQHTTLESEFSSSQSDLSEIRGTAKNAISTLRAYNKLQEDFQMLKVEHEKISTDNMVLQNNLRVDGMQWGIIAVICGVIIAWLIPRLAPRKRRDDGWS